MKYDSDQHFPNNQKNQSGLLTTEEMEKLRSIGRRLDYDPNLGAIPEDRRPHVRFTRWLVQTGRLTPGS